MTDKTINTAQLGEKANKWRPPTTWSRITAIDAHTGGEPLRVFTSGLPELSGTTMLERRRYAQEHLDSLRMSLMWEPRGHADMYGCILTPPSTPEADVGVLFMHNEGFSTMCGHGIIALVTVLIETRMLPATFPSTEVRIDTPAGLVIATAQTEADCVRSVSFQNVPSFVLALDETVVVPSLGSVRYDLAFGGAFYAYVAAADVGVRCVPEDYRLLIDKGMAIKRAIMAARPIAHPLEDDLGFLYGTIFIEPSSAPAVHSRNVCVFAEGEVDRSPTGTGVSGRLALHHARGEIVVGESIVIESIIGSRFTGSVSATTLIGPYEAIIPQVEGSAYITGRHEFFLNPDDELGSGFMLR